MTCDLCGAKGNYEVIWDKAEREKQGKLQSVIIPGHIHSRNVICKNCGLVYVEPKMSREELAKFYAEDYRKIYGGQHSLDAEKRHAQTAYRLMPLGSHLDIGCSTGELLELTGGQGIEPSEEYCKIAKNNGLKVINTTFEEYSGRQIFNVITMLNALEHVYSPTEVLKKIYNLLSEEGIVLISVPNVLSGTLNIPVDAFLSNAHLYNFSAATLGIMMQKCGLKPIAVYLIPEEMGEKVYMIAKKDVEHEIIYDDNIEKRIELTKLFLNYSNSLFNLKLVLSGGIK